MSTQLYWDKEKKLIGAYNPQELTPQQRGNLVFLQGLLDSEYKRGYDRGYQVAYAQFANDGRSKKKAKLVIDKNGNAL